MSKITLPNVGAQFLSQTALNAILQQIKDELNNKVLYRDNPIGEPNSMSNDLDMAGFSILNAELDLPTTDLAVRSVTASQGITGADLTATTSITSPLITADDMTLNNTPDGVTSSDVTNVDYVQTYVAAEIAALDWVETLTSLSPNLIVADDGMGNYTLDASALGGGDVFLAGNNVMTGTNEFQNTFTVNDGASTTYIDTSNGYTEIDSRRPIFEFRTAATATGGGALGSSFITSYPPGATFNIDTDGGDSSVQTITHNLDALVGLGSFGNNVLYVPTVRSLSNSDPLIHVQSTQAGLTSFNLRYFDASGTPVDHTTLSDYIIQVQIMVI